MYGWTPGQHLERAAILDRATATDQRLLTMPGISDDLREHFTDMAMAVALLADVERALARDDQERANELLERVQEYQDLTSGRDIKIEIDPR